MRRFLVGTAGHIDHGKTALVKALTGIDTDRLPEEKRRGITIDLGFAHAEWEGVRVSFVDVPGHERFVRNMLAGAGGIDAVLLVVAADESVMPQTREHFEIVRMLGIRRGLVAVTKTDRVPPELVAVTASDVNDLVAGSFLEGAPVVSVSAKTGEGLESLRSALLSVAGAGEESQREERSARLPVDRAFTVAGFGPVVTGSLVSGTISKEQKLELLPARQIVRVRRVEVHGRETGQARAGERVSVNLASVELSELSRGVVLAAPGAFPTTALLTARLWMLPEAPPLSTGDRVSLHHFAAQTRARVRILEGRRIEPGGSARVQLRLAARLAAIPGDRFVLRRLSPVETIGGGLVLDALPLRAVLRGGPDAAAILDRLEGTVSEKLVLWVEQSGSRGAEEGELSARAGVSAEAVRAALAEPLGAGRVHALRRSPDRWIAEGPLERLAKAAARELAAALESGSGNVGVPRRTLLARLLPDSPAAWAEAVEAALVARGAFVVSGDEARAPGREDLPGAQRELSERVAEVYRRRGLDPPSIVEAAETVRHRVKVVEGLAHYLVKKGFLVRLPGGWLVSRESVDGVVSRLRALPAGGFDVGQFKEMFGLTRRLAIPLLEHLDATRVTRRVGDRREVLTS